MKRHNLPRAVAAAQASHTRNLIEILRGSPVLPDWSAEREARDQPHDPRKPTRAGWDTHHEPEQRRFTVYGTVDSVPMTQGFIGGYEHIPSLSDAGEAAIHIVRRLTGEDFSDILQYGRRRWFGPMG